jgi:hypothetical protein
MWIYNGNNFIPSLAMNFALLKLNYRLKICHIVYEVAGNTNNLMDVHKKQMERLMISLSKFSSTC